MKDDILVIEDFAGPNSCKSIIDAFTRCRPDKATKEIGDGFFDYRVMWASDYPEDEKLARLVLRKWAHGATARVSEFFDEPAIYCDGIQTVIWEGPAMPPHQDDRHPNPNEPHGTPWRFIASVIYLNDDYEGGEIYFPGRGITIKPKKGQLIAFPGAWWHGVNAVPSGVRYTCPSWYSRDRRHEDAFVR